MISNAKIKECLNLIEEYEPYNPYERPNKKWHYVVGYNERTQGLHESFVCRDGRWIPVTNSYRNAMDEIKFSFESNTIGGSESVNQPTFFTPPKNE
jgi:hypothetical protein